MSREKKREREREGKRYRDQRREGRGKRDDQSPIRMSNGESVLSVAAMVGQLR